MFWRVRKTIFGEKVIGISMTNKRNLYTHEIDFKDLKVVNCSRNELRQRLNEVPYRGYRVETVSDGREIVVTKPGGKFTYGNVSREDFMVWVHDPKSKSMCLISHKDIYRDLEEKGQKDRQETTRIIEGLEKVCSGQEPDFALSSFNPPLRNPSGELPEVLLKVYKWIWGQEDCNYPNGEGRERSMKKIRKLREEMSGKR